MLPVLMFACVYLCMCVCVRVCLFLQDYRSSFHFVVSYFLLLFFCMFSPSFLGIGSCEFFMLFLFFACMELFWTCELLNAQTHQFYSINLDCTFHLSFTSFLLSMSLSLALLFVLFLVCLSSGSVMMMNRMNFQ